MNNSINNQMDQYLQEQINFRNRSINRLQALSNVAQTRLIRYWIHHPCLYDRSHIAYRKLNKRQEAWASIGQCMDMRPEEVKKRLLTLRNRFVKEIKMKTDTDKESKWPFFTNCLFLAPHLRLHGPYSEVGSVGDVGDTADFDESDLSIEQIMKPAEIKVENGTTTSQPNDSALLFGQYVAQKIREMPDGETSNQLASEIMKVILQFSKRTNDPNNNS